MALAAIAAFGVSAWAIFGNFSPTYGLVNSLLCVGFVEYWKFQQQELAIRWGVKGVSSIEIKRKDFVGEKVVRDRLTGQETHIFSAPKRMQRQLLQIPFVIAASLALGTVIATCFGIEIFISEVYNGPFKTWLVYCAAFEPDIETWLILLGLPAHHHHHNLPASRDWRFN